MVVAVARDASITNRPGTSELMDLFTLRPAEAAYLRRFFLNHLFRLGDFDLRQWLADARLWRAFQGVTGLFRRLCLQSQEIG